MAAIYANIVIGHIQYLKISPALLTKIEHSTVLMPPPLPFFLKWNKGISGIPEERK
jgi:hypothetical protein